MNAIVTGDGEVFQLSSGWHDFENWSPEIRCTERTTVALLKPEERETSFAFRYYARPNNPYSKVAINSIQAGTFAVDPRTRREIVLPLPDRIRSDITDGKVAQLEICSIVENPFIPSQSTGSSKDNRELDIAVERLWLA